MRGAPPGPFPRSALSVSASSLQNLDLCLAASVLYPDSSCASVSKRRPKVTASSLYTISARESFRGADLLQESKGNLYSVSKQIRKSLIIFSKVSIWMWICLTLKPSLCPQQTHPGWGNEIEFLICRLQSLMAWCSVPLEGKRWEEHGCWTTKAPGCPDGSIIGWNLANLPGLE